MNKNLTINRLAMGNLKTRRKQYTILIIGIILAMIFTSGVPFFVSCMNSSQKELRYKRQGKQEYIVLNAQDVDFGYLMSSNAFLDEPGFAHVLSYAYAPKGDFSDGTMVGYLDRRGRELYYPTLLEGAFPENEGEIIRCAAQSLALKFRMVTEAMEDVIGEPLSAVHMVGGGIKDTMVCRFTASATGKKVLAGPVEATSTGNAAVQLMALGKVRDLTEARQIIKNSFPIKTYEPEDADAWSKAYESFKKIAKM